MKEVKYFEAFDGTLFNEEEKCKEYESSSKENIIDAFRKLIVRESEGLQLTKEGNAFPLAEIAECWWYAVIIMKDENDYEIVKKYATVVKNTNAKIEKVFDKELIVGIGDGDKDKCDYNWFYCYGTIEDAIERYKKTLLTFNKD